MIEGLIYSIILYGFFILFGYGIFKKFCKKQYEEFKRLPFLTKAGTLVMLSVLCVWANTKPEPPKPLGTAQWLMIKASGDITQAEFLDFSAKFVPWLRGLARVETVKNLQESEQEFIQNITQAQGDIIAYKDTVHSNDISRVFLNVDFPLSTPEAQDEVENIAIKIIEELDIIEGGQRFREALVWFNFELATNINISVNCHTSESDYTRLEPVYNSFPDFELLADGENKAYRYRWSIPNELEKPLISETTEVTLGSIDGEGFVMSDIVMEIDEAFYYTFSGVLRMDLIDEGYLDFYVENGLVVMLDHNGIIYGGENMMTAGEGVGQNENI